MRRAIPTDTQTAILVRSRRRCCLCFGLERTLDIVPGQLAHVDRDPSNHALENLAFLCLRHHDAYDSRTRQSKNITAAELVRYRDDLYLVMDRAFTAPVVVGGRRTRVAGDVTGRYAWRRENDQAELQVRLGDEGMLKVSGLALHGTTWSTGPHTGDLDFAARLEHGRLAYREPDERGGYALNLEFSDQTIKATEERVSGRFGAGVSFAGTFAQVD